MSIEAHQRGITHNGTQITNGSMLRAEIRVINFQINDND
jgi:hypothetical protein